jgi:hypothetical protein
MQVRKLESTLGSCVGASGSFFACRRNICLALKRETCSDLQLSLEAVKQGYKVIHDENLIVSYSGDTIFSGESKRKERTIAHGIYTIFTYREMLNPLNFGLFSFQIFSHKICRWICVPFFFLLLIEQYYFIIVAFSIGIVSHYILLRLMGFSLLPIKSLSFLAASMLGLLLALKGLLYGKVYSIWEPTKRK